MISWERPKDLHPKTGDIITEITNNGETMSWVIQGPYAEEQMEVYGSVFYQGPLDKKIVREAKEDSTLGSFYFRSFEESDIRETKTLHKIVIQFTGIIDFDEAFPKGCMKIYLQDGNLNIDDYCWFDEGVKTSKGMVLFHQEWIDHWEHPIGRPADYRKFKAQMKMRTHATAELIITYPKKAMESVDGEIEIIRPTG